MATHLQHVVSNIVAITMIEFIWLDLELYSLNNKKFEYLSDFFLIVCY